MGEVTFDSTRSAFFKGHLDWLLGKAYMMDWKTVAVILFVAGVTTVVYRAFIHPLSTIPGPQLAAITGLWRTYHYARGAWHDDVLKLHNKYGRVVRIAPNEVSVVDAAAMKQLYGHGKSARKTTWYTTWQMPNATQNFFAVQEPKLHAALRKRVSTAYSMSSILRTEKYIQECLDLCFFKLKCQAEAGKIVEMSDWANALAFDIVGELGYGQQLGHLRTESDVNNLRATILDGFKITSVLGHLPGQTRTLNHPITLAIMGIFGVENGFQKFTMWGKQRIVARRNEEDSSERQDMLSHFMNMKSLDGTKLATDEEVLAEISTIVGAGADTTAIGMGSCLYYLCTHSAAYKQLQQEIDEFYETSGLNEPISYSQTQGMPYLRAVVTESLRLFPSIPFQLLRYSPEGGITIDGHYIAAGCHIGISPIAQNRDKAVFGNDANEFSPERWLENPERTSTMESANMTFGGNGPRTCIGKNMALVEINKFIAQLLRNFDVEFVNKDHPCDVTSYWFAHQHNMKMRIRLRPERTIRKVDA